MKFYHAASFLLAFFEVVIISYIGDFGYSDLSTCLIKDTEGKYILSVIFCVNVPLLWVTVLSVLRNPVSRKNRLIKHLVTVAAVITVTWGIPTLCLLLPRNEGLSYLGILLNCSSGILVSISRLGSRHMLKLVKRVIMPKKKVKLRRLTTGDIKASVDTLIVNDYIVEEMCLANLLEGVAKNTAKRILMGVSLIFRTKFCAKCENSYSYKKKKYLFTLEDFQVLEDTLGSLIVDEEHSLEIWEYEHDIFQNIRSVYGWTDIKVTDTFCDRNNFKSLENVNKAGRSSAFIFKTSNSELIVKTITTQEKYLMLEILGKYHDRIVNHPESRIVRIFGMFKIKSNSQSFIIMENLLKCKDMAEIFDLKGSLNDRYTHVMGSMNGVVMKDQNLIQMKRKVLVSREKREEIVKAIHEDAAFFRELNIIDYSLLVAIYPERIGCNNRYLVDGEGELLYSLGIIDFLQQFTLSKKLELAFKRMRCKKGLSVCPSDKYATRFIEFISILFQCA